MVGEKEMKRRMYTHIYIEQWYKCMKKYEKKEFKKGNRKDRHKPLLVEIKSRILTVLISPSQGYVFLLYIFIVLTRNTKHPSDQRTNSTMNSRVNYCHYLNYLITH